MRGDKKVFILFFVFFTFFIPSVNAVLTYRFELSGLAGCGYYIGETNKYIFHLPERVYGVQFRYKYSSRVAFHSKLYNQNMRSYYLDSDLKTHLGGQWRNRLLGIDAAAEYNFFRLGDKQYDLSYKTVSPFIYGGIGGCLHSGFSRFAAYIPVGVGIKWRFGRRCSLSAAWQHHFYFADNMEISDTRYNNTHNMNRWNFFNLDRGGMFFVSLMVEFSRRKPICNVCD